MNIDSISTAISAILFALIFAAIQLVINYGKPPHNRSDTRRRSRPPPSEYFRFPMF